MNERLFSKDNSSALKGVAILFMVFAHLFSRTEFCNLSNPLLYKGRASDSLYDFCNESC